MPRKMNQCGFSIPWISSPSSESPKQKQKSKSHRPPFRPRGIASAAPQPKMKELETQNSNSNSNSNAPLVTQSNSHQSKSKSTNHIRHEQSISTPKAEPHTTTTTASVEKKMMFATSNKNIKAVTPASTTSLDPTARNNNNNVSTIPLSNEDDDVSTLHVDDKTVSVVTLAGDNRGVTMHVAGSHSTRNFTSTEKKDETGKAYVNSNIQSINNSIMSNGSINGRDPGVRVVLPQQAQNDDKEPCLENGKGEVSIKRAERLPYQPVVRRRCLRGLFLEPSDSEADDKPRRHGCKFSCGDITKDKDAVTK